jgi:hypothetical protein
VLAARPASTVRPVEARTPSRLALAVALPVPFAATPPAAAAARCPDVFPAAFATWTTARDRTRLGLQLLHGGGPLAAAGRAEAWRAMATVHPTQAWGIPAGVPRGWSIALKNGFYPMRAQGWRGASTGFVRQGTGGGYAVTVLTDRNASPVQGMRLVETVARRGFAVLAGGPATPRPVERSVCTTTSSREGWATVARRLGSTAVTVRHVSGGNPSPLRGQRACRAELRPA